MENNEDKSIKSVLSKILSQYKLNEGFLSSQAKEAWQEVLGNRIKPYVQEVFVKNKVLFIRISSPILRKELEYRKSETLQEINQITKNSFIQEINYL